MAPKSINYNWDFACFVLSVHILIDRNIYLYPIIVITIQLSLRPEIYSLWPFNYVIAAGLYSWKIYQNHKFPHCIVFFPCSLCPHPSLAFYWMFDKDLCDLSSWNAFRFIVLFGLTTKQSFVMFFKLHHQSLSFIQSPLQRVEQALISASLSCKCNSKYGA